MSEINEISVVLVDRRKNPRKPLSELKSLKDRGLIVTNKVKPGDRSSDQVNVQSISLDDIHAATHLFQNRKTKYSLESTRKIIEAVETGNFKWSVFDPILCWRNPDDQKLYILSGHSRTQSFRILAQRGVKVDGKAFDRIPAKIIDVPFEEAKKIALESNTLSTTETDTERAFYYNQLRNNGISPKELLALSKKNEGRDANRIFAYSFLNPDGRAIEALQTLEKGDITSRSIIQSVAAWIGNVRYRNPQLTDLHETELFTWLVNNGGYGTKAGQVNNYNEFAQKVAYLIQRNSFMGNFEHDKPLNVQNVQQKSSFMQDHEKRLAAAKKEIDQAVKDRKTKLAEMVQRNIDKENPSLFRELSQKQDDLVSLAQRNYFDIQKKQSQVIDAEKAQTSLFGLGAIDDKHRFFIVEDTRDLNRAKKPLAELSKLHRNRLKYVGKFHPKMRERAAFEHARSEIKQLRLDVFTQTGFDKDLAKAKLEAIATASPEKIKADALAAFDKKMDQYNSPISPAMPDTYKQYSNPANVEPRTNIKQYSSSIGPETKTQLIKFVPGNIYKHGWAGDSELTSYYLVLSRTDKSVKITEIDSNTWEPRNSSKVITKKIKLYDNSEYVEPSGKYSMSPILYASKFVKSYEQETPETQNNLPGSYFKKDGNYYLKFQYEDYKNFTDDVKQDIRLLFYWHKKTATWVTKSQNSIPALNLILQFGLSEISEGETLSKKTELQSLSKEERVKRLVVINEKIAAKFFKIAESLALKADKIQENLKHKATNTPKRLREYNVKSIEGDILAERAILYKALGEAWKAGNVPETLKKISPVNAANDIWFFIQSAGSNGYYDYHRNNEYNYQSMSFNQGSLFEHAQKMGWNSKAEIEQAHQALIHLVDSTGGELPAQETSNERKIKEIENSFRFNKIPGFFPTPENLARELVEKASLQTGMTVLEPSAGMGHIAEAIHAAHPAVIISVIEKQIKLQDLLRLKGFNVVGDDFLEHTEKYDAIIMNPPFENGQDQEHVQHAFDLLNPGGRLVSILSSGAFQRSRNKDQAFQAWFEENNGYQEPNEEGAFKSGFISTGVSTVTAVMDKPRQVVEEPEEGNNFDAYHSEPVVSEISKSLVAKYLAEKDYGSEQNTIRYFEEEKEKINKQIDELTRKGATDTTINTYKQNLVDKQYVIDALKNSGTPKPAPEPETQNPEPETQPVSEHFTDSFYKLNSDNKIELHLPSKEAYINLPEDVKKDIKSGFIYGRQRGAWVSRSKGGYIPWSMSKYNIPYTQKDEVNSFQDMEDNRVNRLKNKAERFETYSDNASKRGEIMQREFNELRKDWAWITQPNVYSSGGRRFTNSRNRVLARYEKGMKEHQKAGSMASYANELNIRATQRELKDLGYLQNRLAENKKLLKAWPGFEKQYNEKMAAGNLDDSTRLWLDGQMNRFKLAFDKYEYYLHYYNELVEQKKEAGTFFDEEAAKKTIKKDFKTFLKNYYDIDLEHFSIAYKAKGPTVYFYRTTQELPEVLQDHYGKTSGQKSIVTLLAIMKAVKANQEPLSKITKVLTWNRKRLIAEKVTHIGTSRGMSTVFLPIQVLETRSAICGYYWGYFNKSEFSTKKISYSKIKEVKRLEDNYVYTDSGKEIPVSPEYLAILAGLGAAEITTNQRDYGVEFYKPTYQMKADYSTGILGGTGTVTNLGVGDLDATLKVILETIRDHHNQVRELAKILKAGSVMQSAFNIWHWMKRIEAGGNLNYKLDSKGKEEIRTPARTYADRITGVDCDDMAIFSASLLIEMGYQPTLHVVAFNGNQNYGHIYTVVDGIVVDSVMKRFDTHPANITKRKILDMLKLQVLDGLGNANTNADSVTIKLLTEQSNLMGQIRETGHSPAKTKQMRKLSALIALDGQPERSVLLRVMPLVDDIDKDGNLVFINSKAREAAGNYSANYFDVEEGNIQGLGATDAELKEAALAKFYEDIEGIDGLGKWQPFKKVKAAVKKFTGWAKETGAKVVKGLNKINPGFVAVRSAFRALLALNFLGWSNVLYAGMSGNKTAEKAYNKVEKIWENFGGDRAKLKASIRTGKARKPLFNKKAAGNLEGLGSLLATIAASVTAALPVAIPAAKELKGLFDKLFPGKRKENSSSNEVDNMSETDLELLKSAQAQPTTTNSTNYTPWLIGGGIAASVALLFMLKK